MRRSLEKSKTECRRLSLSLSLSPRLFITMAILWTVNDFFYVAGTLNAENLSGDMFVNFSLISLTEMPSVFIGQFLIGM